MFYKRNVAIDPIWEELMNRILLVKPDIFWFLIGYICFVVALASYICARGRVRHLHLVVEPQDFLYASKFSALVFSDSFLFVA